MVRGCLVNGKDSCAAAYHMTLTGCNRSIPTTIVRPPPKGRYFGAVKGRQGMLWRGSLSYLRHITCAGYAYLRKQADCCK